MSRSDAVLGGALALVSALPSWSAQPSVMLRLRFAAGQFITERAAIVDRISWVLPKKRLDQFRRSGIVIDEQRRTTIVSRALVERVQKGEAVLAVDTSVETIDVPRRRSTRRNERSQERVSVFHTPTVHQPEPMDVVEAATADFPRAAMHAHSSWTTTQSVTTTLGSGLARFTHVIASISETTVRIDITGIGTITGAEYNLPKLLPGSIRLHGQAWYDRSSGLIVRERYSVRNRLLKPAGAGQIGFDERETVEIHTRG